jgi:flagellar biosynthesis GTPase FlhF
MKFTRNIIGFRSGNRRNKIIASTGYVLFLIGLLVATSNAPTAWDSFVHALAWILLFLSIVIPIANIFSVRRKFFFFNRKSFIGKVLGIFGYVVLTLIVCAVVGFDMESATAKQMEAKQQAEQVAKANVEASAKVKAEQIKAKDDAKAKAQADAQAKAQADAQAKAQADAQAKAQADAQAKAKAQADAQAKAQADAQAKAQADAQAKVQAQQATVQILSISDPAPRNSIYFNSKSNARCYSFYFRSLRKW